MDGSLVSVIVLSRNVDYLKICIPSIYLSDYPSVEIVLVYYGKDRDSLFEQVVNKYRGERIPLIPVLLDRNMGYAGGNCKGLEFASGEYILVLNDDTELAPWCISNLVKSFDLVKNVGIVGGTMLNFEQPFRRTETIEVFEDPHATGSCLMISRKLIEDIGFFDEDFFIYFEEYDLNWRAANAGYKVLTCRSAPFHHRWGGTVNSGQLDRYLCFKIRNYAFMGLKNGNFRQVITHVKSPFWNIVKGLIKLDKYHTRCALWASLSFLRRFKVMYRKRVMLKAKSS
jgi:GT2 family glycosyltransferase